MTSGSRVSAEIFQPVRNPRTFEDVVRQIAEAIRSGILREADLLPGERLLAERMEVSRPTVRAAIGQLCKAGVLSIESGRTGGARIASIWIPQGLQLRHADSLPVDDVLRSLEARRALEPRIAQLASIRAKDEDFRAMRESIELQRQHKEDRHKALQAEERFHRIMWRAADNPVLQETMVRLFADLEVVRDMIMRDEAHMEIALDLHEDTLRALMRGDSVTIDAAMHEHLRYTENLAAEVLDRRVRIPNVLLPDRGTDGNPGSSAS